MENKRIDEILDKLLSAKKAEVSNGFMAKFEACLNVEIQAEGVTDNLLKKQKVRAAHCFTEMVMRQIRMLKVKVFFKTVVPAFAAVASVALAFTLFTRFSAAPDQSLIFDELSMLDSQIASFDSFVNLSENYVAKSRTAIAAFLDDENF